MSCTYENFSRGVLFQCVQASSYRELAWLDKYIQRAGEEMWKRQSLVRDGCNRRLDAIACKIDLLQEMGNFVAADAEDDLKDFRAGGFLARA